MESITGFRVRDGEQIVWSGKPLSLKTAHIVLFLIFTWYLFFPIIIVILWAHWIKNAQYAITNQRVWMRTGILGKTTRSAEWGKVTDLETRLSFWGKIRGYNSIIFQTAGTPWAELAFYRVSLTEDIIGLAEEQLGKS